MFWVLQVDVFEKILDKSSIALSNLIELAERHQKIIAEAAP